MGIMSSVHGALYGLLANGQTGEIVITRLDEATIICQNASGGGSGHLCDDNLIGNGGGCGGGNPQGGSWIFQLRNQKKRLQAILIGKNGFFR